MTPYWFVISLVLMPLIPMLLDSLVTWWAKR
jgi:hypothetical protein